MTNRRSFLNKISLLSATAITANVFQPAWSRNLKAALKNAESVAPTDLASEDDNYLVQQYTNAFTPKTKLVQITHMINWIGQKIPIKKIADIAKKNIEVLVDGAHTFAQFEFLIPDLNCDYFGTSLHKWLSAPIGTGMLYVRKQKIKTSGPCLALAKNKKIIYASLSI
jgi:selenocysteine lyase/cysteine desulfurase